MNETAPLPLMNNAHMPQWTRVTHIDRANYPKPFLKDRLQPLPDVTNLPFEDGAGLHEDYNSSSQNTDNSSNARIVYLEKSMLFLRNQHRDMLSSLQDEVERLRQENKNISLQLVLAGGSTPAPVPAPAQTPGDAVQSTDTISSGSAGRSATLLQKQLDATRAELLDEKNKNQLLQQLLDQQTVAIKKERELARAKAAAMELTSSEDQDSESSLPTELQLGRVRVLVNPLMICSEDDPQPREPTLKEAESIIRHLCRDNHRQEQELTKLRADLRDVLYRGKWRPEAAPTTGSDSARTAHSDSSSSGACASGAALGPSHLMQGQRILPMKPGLTSSGRKPPELNFVVKDTVSLPALKQSIPGNRAAERRRRTQILQKGRMKPDAHSHHQQ